ncbi:patatin-like phospholipase domain-containing protein 4 isoform X5 [Ovis aries]|uniref:patatin-like phospholipase domain-containing protein 4 isoform X5 n=1 Tax=Ovis aries TaxID=9940 RepID=UPI00295270EC|nr:patatin-like phospholipase domain-containing protein 4 isoform X5 [Ovis aries]
MKPINLSFAACGFLGIYHLGAASALCKHGGKLLKDVKAFAGASAGSLVASVLLTAPQKIEECNKFTYDFAEEIRRQPFGALTPGYDFMARLRSGVESILPANAHELAHGRLHVSITNSRTGRNCLASSFPSREDLVQSERREEGRDFEMELFRKTEGGFKGLERSQPGRPGKKETACLGWNRKGMAIWLGNLLMTGSGDGHSAV